MLRGGVKNYSLDKRNPTVYDDPVVKVRVSLRFNIRPRSKSGRRIRTQTSKTTRSGKTSKHFPKQLEGWMLILPQIANNPPIPYREEIIFSSLPYDGFRVGLDCGHSFLYLMKNYEEQPPFCGLCFFKQGFEAELPTRIHVSVNPRYSTLAENGNPETAPKFFSHLYLAMGLKGPRAGESLKQFRHQRSPRAREQYTSPAWRLFPVASSLWKLMGYQPPLGIVLVAAVGGRTELEIAKTRELSLMNVHQRMVKAIRTAMGYLLHANTREDSRSSGGEKAATETS